VCLPFYCGNSRHVIIFDTLLFLTIKTKQKMVVTFAIYQPTGEGGGRSYVRDVILSDSQVTSSKYITENLASYRNPVIEVPSQYYDVIDIYLNFLLISQPYNASDPFKNYRKHTEVVFVNNLMNIYDNITDVNTLVSCFYLESYFDDDLFLSYLMVQVYRIWDEFQPAIKELPNTRLFYLHVPFPLCAETIYPYIESTGFCRDWAKIEEENGGLGVMVITDKILLPFTGSVIHGNITTHYHTYTMKYYPDSDQLMELQVIQRSYRDGVEPIAGSNVLKRYRWSSDGVIDSVIPQLIAVLDPKFENRPVDIRQLMPRVIRPGYDSHSHSNLESSLFEKLFKTQPTTTLTSSTTPATIGSLSSDSSRSGVRSEIYPTVPRVIRPGYDPHSHSNLESSLFEKLFKTQPTTPPATIGSLSSDSSRSGVRSEIYPTVPETVASNEPFVWNPSPLNDID